VNSDLEEILQRAFVAVCLVIAVCAGLLAASGTLYVIYLIAINMRSGQ